MPGGGIGAPPPAAPADATAPPPGLVPPPGMGARGAPPGPPSGAAAPQATRHARRLYIGSLPPSANEAATTGFFNQALRAVGGAAADQPGEPVLNTYFNAEKRFAFVEFRTVEETSNALGLDGVVMDAQSIRVRRPNDYNAVAAAPLGPALPSPSLNLAAVGVTAPAPGAAPAGASVPPEDQANRLFIGGLPYFLTEPMVKELVEAFGPTKSFKLVVDPDTGNSKGYGFFVYEDHSVTDVACQGLHGMKMGDKTLTVKRATGEKRDTGTGDAAPAAAAALPGTDAAALQAAAAAHLAAAGGGAPPPPPAAASNPPSHVVFLSDMFEIDELRDDGEFADIEEDVRDECGKFGSVVEVAIPRPRAPGDETPVPGLGKAFVRYETVAGATAARDALHGRKFGGKVVNADFIDVDAFERRAF